MNGLSKNGNEAFHWCTRYKNTPKIYTMQHKRKTSNVVSWPKQNNFKSTPTKSETPDSPSLIFDGDRLSWLYIDFIMVAGTFGHRNTDAVFI